MKELLSFHGRKVSAGEVSAASQELLPAVVPKPPPLPAQWESSRNPHGKEQGCDPEHSGKTQNERRAKEKTSPGADEEEQERMGMGGSGEDCSIFGWCEKKRREASREKRENRRKLGKEEQKEMEGSELEKEKERDQKSQKAKTLREENSSD